MSNPYTGTVASALRKCQLLVSAAMDEEVAAMPPSHPAALMHAAGLEGALLQLWRAYRAFLAEQAHQLNLGAEPESAKVLRNQALANQKVSAEVEELVGLAENPDSWFCQLEHAWRSLWRLSSQAGARSSVERGGAGGQGAVQDLIPSVQVADSSGGGLSAEQLARWHQNLSELIARQRAQGQEW